MLTLWMLDLISHKHAYEDDIEAVCGLSQGVMPSELPVQEADCRNSQNPVPLM